MAITSAYENICEQLAVDFVDCVADRRGSILLKVSHEDSLAALKISQQDTVSHDVELQITREARTLRSLGHLAGDLYIDDGLLIEGGWLLMRWLSGKNLTDKLADCPNPESQVVTMADVARQFAVIHAEGALHRDVQPDHIFFETSKDRDPTILDWGLADYDDMPLPYKGALVHFASPEVANGMLHDTDDIPYTAASEVYSLGATFFTALYQKHVVAYPPHATFAAKKRAVAEGLIAPFPDAHTKLEKKIQDIFRDCIDQYPHNRPTMNELVNSFREVA